MFLVDKLKGDFKTVIKEHIFSFGLFFLGCILWAIDVDSFVDNNSLDVFFLFGYKLLMGVSIGALCCEAIHLNLESSDDSYLKKSSIYKIIYVILMVVSFAATFQFVFVYQVSAVRKALGEAYDLYRDLSTNIFICYVALYLALSVFFFYKRGKESFETYTAKAFCGLMKAELVYGIVSIGVFLIILAFDTLIVDTTEISLLDRMEILIMGVIGYPLSIIGLSKTDGKISKFGKVVLSYVFTVLLAVAFLIIYVYIFKILFAWKFPSNEVFSILTALFAFGVVIWTMALGCCDEALTKVFRLFPLLFIPFIVLQVMCLYMRVVDYGYTTSRYLGLAVIVFEIVYFAIYIFDLISKKMVMWMVLFVLAISAFAILLMPGINMYSVITRSQKQKIERYISLGDNAKSADGAAAYEAYRTIKNEGGLIGQRFIDLKLSDDQIEKMDQMTGSSLWNGSFNLSVHKDFGIVDVSGYSEMTYVECFYNADIGDEFSSDDIHLYRLDENANEISMGSVDVSDVVEALVRNYELDADYYEDQEVISKSINVTDGGTLIFDGIYADGNRLEDGTIYLNYLQIEGYVLK